MVPTHAWRLGLALSKSSFPELACQFHWFTPAVPPQRMEDDGIPVLSDGDIHGAKVRIEIDALCAGEPSRCLCHHSTKTPAG